MVDGATLAAAAGVGLAGGVIGALLVLFVSGKRCRSSSYIHPSSREPAELEELNKKVDSMGERQRRNSTAGSNRELRQALAILSDKIDRITSGDYTPADEEGDWSGWTATTLASGEAKQQPLSPAVRTGWAKELTSHRLILPAVDDPGKPLPVPTILFTDMGGASDDVGDAVALFLLRGLETLEFVEAKAVIVGGEGPPRRIDRADHILGGLGFGEGLRLGCGGEGGGSTSRDASPSPLTPKQTRTESPAVPRTSVPASEAFFSVLEEDGLLNYSLVVCLMCAATDFAAILRERGEAVARKLKCVCLLGSVFEARRGVDALTFPPNSSGKTYRGADWHLRPDPTHPLYLADPSACEYVYQRLQELGVPLVVVGRHSVYKAAVPAALYDELAATNSPVAKELKESQRKAIDELWRRVQSPNGSSERGGLPARCTAEWFAQVFCGGSTPPLGSSPWELIQTFNMYDCVALCAAVPELRSRMFSDDPEHSYDVGTAINLLYGQSEALSGVRRPKELRQLIHAASLAGLSSTPEPYPMLIFTDPGQDLDDELTMIVLRSLVAKRYVRPIGLVANLQPAAARAQLLKGTLRVLGLPDVPVAIGTDGGRTDHVDTFSDTAGSYMATEEGAVETDYLAMCQRVLAAEADNTVVCLCISSLKDAWGLLQAHEGLFESKIHSVTIMGGIELSDEAIIAASDHTSPPAKRSSEGGGESKRRKSKEFGVSGVGGTADRSVRLLKPDTANNNTFDFEASQCFYRRVQELSIRLNVLTRFAAYGCPMPRKVYDMMHNTGSPIALRLFKVQQKSIEDLWRRCNASGEERLGLPARCDKEWYCKTFLKGAGSDRKGSDSIWDLVSQLNMYDVLALVFAVPHLAWRFFEPAPLGAAGVNGGEAARLVGLSPKKTGIKSAENLRQFVIDGLLDGLRLSDSR